MQKRTNRCNLSTHAPISSKIGSFWRTALSGDFGYLLPETRPKSTELDAFEAKQRKNVLCGFRLLQFTKALAMVHGMMIIACLPPVYAMWQVSGREKNHWTHYDRLRGTSAHRTSTQSTSGFRLLQFTKALAMVHGMMIIACLPPVYAMWQVSGREKNHWTHYDRLRGTSAHRTSTQSTSGFRLLQFTKALAMVHGMMIIACLPPVYAMWQVSGREKNHWTHYDRLRGTSAHRTSTQSTSGFRLLQFTKALAMVHGMMIIACLPPVYAMWQVSGREKNHWTHYDRLRGTSAHRTSTQSTSGFRLLQFTKALAMVHGMMIIACLPPVYAMWQVSGREKNHWTHYDRLRGTSAHRTSTQSTSGFRLLQFTKALAMVHGMMIIACLPPVYAMWQVSGREKNHWTHYDRLRGTSAHRTSTQSTSGFRLLQFTKALAMVHGMMIIACLPPVYAMWQVSGREKNHWTHYDRLRGTSAHRTSTQSTSGFRLLQFTKALAMVHGMMIIACLPPVYAMWQVSGREKNHWTHYDRLRGTSAHRTSTQSTSGFRLLQFTKALAMVHGMMIIACLPPVYAMWQVSGREKNHWTHYDRLRGTSAHRTSTQSTSGFRLLQFTKALAMVHGMMIIACTTCLCYVASQVVRKIIAHYDRLRGTSAHRTSTQSTSGFRLLQFTKALAMVHGMMIIACLPPVYAMWQVSGREKNHWTHYDRLRGTSAHRTSTQSTSGFRLLQFTKALAMVHGMMIIACLPPVYAMWQVSGREKNHWTHYDPEIAHCKNKSLDIARYIVS